MAWIWGKQGFDQTIAGIAKAPHLFAYGSILWAFLAGFQLRGIVGRNHSAAAFDNLNGLVFLVVALLWTTCIVKAIQRLQPNRGIDFILEWIEDFQHQRSSVPALLHLLDSILYGNRPNLSPELRSVVLEAANDLRASEKASASEARQVPEDIVSRLKSVLVISRGAC